MRFGNSNPVHLKSLNCHIQTKTNPHTKSPCTSMIVLSLPKLVAVLAAIAFFISCPTESFAISLPEYANAVKITREVQELISSHKKWDSISFCNNCYSDPREQKSCIEERSHCSKKMKAPYSMLERGGGGGLKLLLEFARRPYDGPLYCEGMRVLQDKISNPCLSLSDDITMVYVSAFETEFIRGLMEAHVDVEHELVSVKEYLPRNSRNKMPGRMAVTDLTTFRPDMPETDLNEFSNMLLNVRSVRAGSNGPNGHHLFPVVAELTLTGKWKKHKKQIESMYRVLYRKDLFRNLPFTVHSRTDKNTMYFAFHFRRPHIQESI